MAQLAGYVAEHSAYHHGETSLAGTLPNPDPDPDPTPNPNHHGETSLAGTIVGMAQTFVGSNNIALLHPAGQFGTRLLGGKVTRTGALALAQALAQARARTLTRTHPYPDPDPNPTPERDQDAASPRYIFTRLPALTRLIFHPADDALLEYQEDDGQAIA